MVKARRGKAGRPAKSGARTASGQLSRAKPVLGNERAEQAKSIYRGNGSDPIGRAYERGLLGTGPDARGGDAKTMLDTARAINRAYWAAYTVGPLRSCIADRASGADIVQDAHRERRVEQWLTDMLKTASRGGHAVRTVFDQLVIDIQPDEGPQWLDRLIDGGAGANDWGLLAAALDALADCSDVQRLTLRRRA